MRKQTFKGLAFIAIASSLLSSCDLLKDIEYKVTPNPLEMHGDSVKISVSGSLPVKGIKKKVKVDITPMLGSTELESFTIQGEKVSGNGTVIKYKSNGSFKYSTVVAYKPEFETADLMVTGKVYKGKKEKKDKFPDTKIGDATIITPYLVNKTFRVIFAKDNFVRTTQQSYSAKINFDKAKAIVKPNELKDKDIVDYSKWLTAAQTNPKIAIKSVSIEGYASPEGEETVNNPLSDERAKATQAAVIELAKKANNTVVQSTSFNLIGKGEDITGFENEMGKTSFPQDKKDQVVRVLKSFSPEERAQGMADMAKIFTELEKAVFPVLRRADIITNYDLTGYSDEELKALAKSSPDSLKLEELLFTATLVSDWNEKLRIYQVAQKNFPNDYRTHNNVGAVLFLQGKYSEAKTNFEKANSLNSADKLSQNNLGAVAGVNGDRKKARELFKKASGAGDEVKYNNGVLDIQDGKYDDAAKNFGTKENHFNRALNQILTGDAAGAVKTIDGSTDKETAQGYYLKAIAGARQSNVDALANNLKNAIAKDASYKAKAAKDREFIKFFDNPTFTNVVK